MKIESVFSAHAITILFDDLVHVHLKLKNLIAFQSWYIEGEYVIEYHFQDAEKIRSTYNDRGLWIEVLNHLKTICI